jgi:hypothetical protein
MSDFVAECRREWKRLRVPEAVADEMAADLAADLSEAAAEGVSPKEVLGAGANDPRSFAASWALERGLIESRPPKSGLRTRSVLLAAIALLSAAAIAAGVAMILAAPSASTSQPDRGLVRSDDGHLWRTDGLGPGVDAGSIIPLRGGKIVRRVTYLDPTPGSRGVQDVATGRIGVQTVNLTPVLSAANNPPPRWPQDTGSHTIAWSLLIAGIVGVLVMAPFWLRVRRRHEQPLTVARP